MTIIIIIIIIIIINHINELIDTKTTLYEYD